MPSQGQTKDPEDSQMIHLAKAWANANGGRIWLEAVNKLEMAKKNQTILNKELFNISEKEFMAYGETKVAHLQWRQIELYELCERMALQMANELNHNDAYENQNIQEEYEYGQDESNSTEFVEPNITWQQLEEAATEWYLKTKKETSFELNEESYLSFNPNTKASVRYYEWENNNKKKDRQKLLTKNKCDKNTQGGVGGTRSQTMEDLKWEDLEIKELNNHEVCTKIIDWLKIDKNTISTKTEQIKEALKTASTLASKKHRKDLVPFPIKLRHNSDFHFHKLAMVELGKPGGGSAKYRVIIQKPNIGK